VCVFTCQKASMFLDFFNVFLFRNQIVSGMKVCLK